MDERLIFGLAQVTIYKRYRFALLFRALPLCLSNQNSQIKLLKMTNKHSAYCQQTVINCNRPAILSVFLQL